jgi:hypothetical protein
LTGCRPPASRATKTTNVREGLGWAGAGGATPVAPRGFIRGTLQLGCLPGHAVSMLGIARGIGLVDVVFQDFFVSGALEWIGRRRAHGLVGLGRCILLRLRCLLRWDISALGVFCEPRDVRREVGKSYIISGPGLAGAGHEGAAQRRAIILQESRTANPLRVVKEARVLGPRSRRSPWLQSGGLGVGVVLL